MDWQAQSEVTFGLLLEGKENLNRFRPQMFIEPYDEGFKVLIEEGDPNEKERRVIEAIGLPDYMAAKSAVAGLNGQVRGVDWAGGLERLAGFYDAGEMFARFSKELKQGKEVDWARINEVSERAQMGTVSKFIGMGDVEAIEQPLVASGVPAIDAHIGGWPSPGMTIIGGNPKIGKTSLALGVASAYTVAHKKQQVAFFTLEMTSAQLKHRYKQLDLPWKMRKSDLNRIRICDEIVSATQIINYASTVPEIGMVIVDFADLIAEQEISETVMSHIYKTLAKGAKKLNSAVIVLSQFNRKYEGGVPRPHHIRYSGLSEALISLEMLLWNPGRDYFNNKNKDDNCGLRIIDGEGYWCCWLARFGTKHDDEFPGAIAMPFSGKAGWDFSEQGDWYLLKR